MPSEQPLHNNKKSMIQDMIVKKKVLPIEPQQQAPQPSEMPKADFVPVRKNPFLHAKLEPEKEHKTKTKSVHNPVIHAASVSNASKAALFFKAKAARSASASGVKDPFLQGAGTETIKKRKWYVRKPFLILYGVLLFTSFLFIVDIFSSVTVAVTPHQEFFKIDTLLKLSADSNGRGAETIRIEEAMQGQNPTHGEKNIEEKASGKITVYNEFSSDPQVLVKRTRFETPDGKIYRIAEQITVPGAVIKDGKVERSSVDVTVWADEPGTGYNIGPSDFTIPGFKGSPRFDTFYAKSLGPMSGGFKGVSKVVTEEDANGLASSLQTQLSEELKRRSVSELPEGLFIPEGAIRIATVAKDFSAGIGKPADTLTLDLSLKLNGLAVSYADIEDEIISRYLAKDGLEKDGFDIVNIPELSYSAEEIDFDKGTITLRIQGLAHVAWSVDYNELARKLADAGYRKEANVFSQYPSIEEAAILFSPSWWHIFPSDTGKINVERKLFESP